MDLLAQCDFPWFYCPFDLPHPWDSLPIYHEEARKERHEEESCGSDYCWRRLHAYLAISIHPSSDYDAGTNCLCDISSQHNPEGNSVLLVSCLSPHFPAGLSIRRDMAGINFTSHFGRLYPGCLCGHYLRQIKISEGPCYRHADRYTGPVWVEALRSLRWDYCYPYFDLNQVKIYNGVIRNNKLFGLH